jgi:hypothetical protein
VDWSDALDGLDVTILSPAGSPSSAGHDAPSAALAAAGGLPSSAPETPLLVAVNDADRSTITAPALAAVRDAAGSRPLRVLVATGSHVFSDDVKERFAAPLREAAGPGVELRWHVAGDEHHAMVGEWSVDSWLAEARDVVGIGSVEPHWFAGLTGSYKTLSIGLLPREAIARSHRLALEPTARPLRLEGNPVHEEIARTAHGLLEGRAVVALDHLGECWAGGSPLENLRTLLHAARARWGCTVREPLDFLVTRIRPPLDRVLYQAEKGLKNSEHAVRDGGAIVIDAACEDGVGPRRFMDLLLAAPDAASARAVIDRDGYRLGDHKAVRWRVLQERGVAIAAIAPGFPPAEAAAAGLTILADATAAGGWLRQRLASGSRGAVVEDAAHTIVEVAA